MAADYVVVNLSNRKVLNMDSKQIICHAIHIEKYNKDRNYGNVMPLLIILDDACVSLEQLQGTDIVRVLYRVLKTCSDPSVKKTVKCLLSKWKKMYSHPNDMSEDKISEKVSVVEKTKETLAGKAWLGDRGDLCAGDTSKALEQGEVPEQGVTYTGSRLDRTLLNRDECEGATGDGLSSLQEGGRSSSGSTLHSLAGGSRTSATTAQSTPPCCDQSSALRSKCVRLLLSALGPEGSEQEGSEEEGKTTELAGDIEQHIYALHGVNQAKYKACVRSKVANLRNPRSRHLRRGLLSGGLGAEAFARMSVQEMASEDLRRLREEYSSQGVSERQLPLGVEGTPTQKLRCRRCEGADCKVTQVSRGTLFLPAWVRRGSPDEDAMTFVTCSGCGEQWYHSGWGCL